VAVAVTGPVAIGDGGEIQRDAPAERSARTPWRSSSERAAFETLVSAEPFSAFFSTTMYCPATGFSESRKRAWALATGCSASRASSDSGTQAPAVRRPSAKRPSPNFWRRLPRSWEELRRAGDAFFFMTCLLSLEWSSPLLLEPGCQPLEQGVFQHAVTS
jgi:hypothetical protein